MEQVVAMLCIGCRVWWPSSAGVSTAAAAAAGVEVTGSAPVASIQELADLRASVGVQWMLFQQCMTAARQAIDMVRTLQRLVGVSRGHPPAFSD